MPIFNRASTVIKDTPTAPRVVRRAVDKGSVRGGHKQEDDVRRGTPEWHQKLVDWALEYKKRYLKYWNWVDKEYRRDDIREGGSIEGPLDLDSFEEVKSGRVYNVVSTTQSMVFNARPKFNVDGWTGQNEDQARVIEQIVNIEWQEGHKVTPQMELCVRDCIKYGLGIAMTTYTMAEGEEKISDEQAEDEALEDSLDPITDAFGQDVAEATAEQIALTPPEPEEYTVEQRDDVVLGEVATVRVSPYQFYVDPDAPDFKRARFMGRFMILDLDSVRSNKDFNRNRFKVQATDSSRLTGSDGKSYSLAGPGSSKTPYDQVCLCDQWERIPGKGWVNTIFVLDQNIVLYKDKGYWTGHPFRMLAWNADSETIYPASDLVQLHHLLLAEWSTSTAHIARLLSEQPITAYDDGAGIPKDLLEGVFAHPKIGKWLKARRQGENRPLSDNFHTIFTPQNTADSLATLRFLDQAFLVSQGLGQNQVGQTMRSETSATEAANVREFSIARAAPKQSAVQDFLTGVAYDRIARYAEFKNKDTDWAARLVGPDKAAAWGSIDWTEGHAQSGMRITIFAGSMNAKDDQTMSQALITYLTLAAQFPEMLVNTNVPNIQLELLRLLGFHDDGELTMGATPEDLQAIRAAMTQIGAGGGQQGGSPPGQPAQPSGEASQNQVAATDTAGVQA